MSTPKQIARSLLRENRKNERSWRTIAREDYDNKVNPSTLCRFAISRGKWKPKDKAIQARLGILKKRKVQPKMITKTISKRTENELIESLRNRTPMKEQSRIT